jgi:hypothetical protein
MFRLTVIYSDDTCVTLIATMIVVEDGWLTVRAPNCVYPICVPISVNVYQGIKSFTIEAI